MEVEKGSMTVVGRFDAKKLRDRVANKTRKNVDFVVAGGSSNNKATSTRAPPKWTASRQTKAVSRKARRRTRPIARRRGRGRMTSRAAVEEGRGRAAAKTTRNPSWCVLHSPS
jgi:hypothetical protein